MLYSFRETRMMQTFNARGYCWVGYQYLSLTKKIAIQEKRKWRDYEILFPGVGIRKTLCVTVDEI